MKAAMATRRSSRLGRKDVMPKIPRPKIQTPDKLQIQSADQAPSNAASAFGDWRLVFLWCSDLGVWSLLSSFQTPAARDEHSRRAPLEEQDDGGQHGDLAHHRAEPRLKNLIGDADAERG